MAEPQLLVIPPLGLVNLDEWGTPGVWDPQSHPVVTYDTGHLHLKSGIGAQFTAARFGYFGELDGEAGVLGGLTETFEVDWACVGGFQSDAVPIKVDVQVREPYPNEDGEHPVMLNFSDVGIRQVYPTPSQFSPYVVPGTSGTWAFTFESFNGVDEFQFPKPCAFAEIPYPFGYVTIEVGFMTAHAWASSYYSNFEMNFVFRSTGTPLPWEPPAGEFWTGFVKAREVAVA